jgi:hypothetical protein
MIAMSSRPPRLPLELTLTLGTVIAFASDSSPTLATAPDGDWRRDARFLRHVPLYADQNES